jgi:cell wall-associated NlpC family hydrolase
MIDWDQYVGIPWAEKGRNEWGADCYGLIRLIYRNELGIELPAYTDAYLTTIDRKAVAEAIHGNWDSRWREVPPEAVEPLDGVLMREGGHPTHMGLVVKPGVLIHMVRDKDSVIERYETGSLRHRIVGFYRYER